MKMPLLIFATTTFLFGRLSSAEPDSLEVSVSALPEQHQEDRVRDEHAEGEGHYRYEFLVTLRNRGKSAILVPKGIYNRPVSLIISVEDSRESYLLANVWDIPSVGKIDFDIPSQAELGLVNLESGEITRMRIAIRMSQKIDRERVAFIYQVTNRLAARFKCWEGKVEVRVKPVRL